jgi:flagellar protein FlgJ
MDVAATESLAGGIDPRALSALKDNPNDPATRRAVADQFSAMLMEGLMRNADGSPLSMVQGTGSGTVNELYTNVMSEVAASSNQLGFADMLLRSMPTAASKPAAIAPATTAAAPGAGPAAPAPASSAAPSAATHGFSLLQYWQGRRVIVTPGAPLATGPMPLGERPIGLPPQAPLAAPSAAASVPRPATAPSVMAPSPYGPDPASGLSGELQLPNDTPVASTAQQQQFATALAPLVQRAAQDLGVSPNVLLAQAALESGWGRSMPGNNIFGVKAGSDWTGGTVQAYTHEISAAGDTGETADFRAYPSVAAAVADYVRLIAQNTRYRAALDAGNDPRAYGQALVAGGYATDPDYASKLAAVAASPTIAAALGTAGNISVAQTTVSGGDA